MVVDPGWRGLQLSAGFSGRLGKLVFIPNRHHRSMGRIEDVPWIIDDTARSPTVSHLGPRIMVGVVGVLRRRIHLCRSICPMPSPGLAWTHRRIGGGVPDFFLLEAQKPAPSTPWSKNVPHNFLRPLFFCKEKVDNLLQTPHPTPSLLEVRNG